MLEYAQPNGWERFLVDELLAITGETLFIQRTAAEMIWGYEEPTLKLAKQAAERFFNRTFNFDDLFGLMRFVSYKLPDAFCKLQTHNSELQKSLQNESVECYQTTECSFSMYYTRKCGAEDEQLFD